MTVLSPDDADDEDDSGVARRFEFIIDGLELANGYFELNDYSEHVARFARDNQIRKERELPLIDVDEDFLGSIGKGLPFCSGVAMGFDRLLMLKTGSNDIGTIQLF